MYSPSEWQTALEKIFELLEGKSSNYLPHVYEYIAKLENRSDKILKYVEQAPSTIIELYPYLIADYRDRVEEIFMQHILSEARGCNR